MPYFTQLCNTLGLAIKDINLIHVAFQFHYQISIKHFPSKQMQQILSFHTNTFIYNDNAIFLLKPHVLQKSISISSFHIKLDWYMITRCCTGITLTTWKPKMKKPGYVRQCLFPVSISAGNLSCKYEMCVSGMVGAVVRVLSYRPIHHSLQVPAPTYNSLLSAPPNLLTSNSW